METATNDRLDRVEAILERLALRSEEHEARMARFESGFDTRMTQMESAFDTRMTQMEGAFDRRLTEQQGAFDKRLTEQQTAFAQNHIQLSKVVEALAASAVVHDKQIAALTQRMDGLTERMDTLIVEWRAYLTTIHPRQ